MENWLWKRLWTCHKTDYKWHREMCFNKHINVNDDNDDDDDDDDDNKENNSNFERYDIRKLL